jgi:hypothetical protein
MGRGQTAEGVVGAVFGGAVFDDVARCHVLENIVGVSGSLDNEVAVVLEPFD